MGLVTHSKPSEPLATVDFCFENIGQEYGEGFPRDLKEGIPPSKLLNFTPRKN